jgi:hypothetical protein
LDLRRVRVLRVHPRRIITCLFLVGRMTHLGLQVRQMARLAYTAVNATDVEEGQGAPDLSHRRPESNRWRKIYCMTIVLVVAFVGLVGYWRSGSTTSTTSPSLSEAATGRPQLADRLGAERTRLVLKLLGVRHSNDAELLKAVRSTPAAIAMLHVSSREREVSSPCPWPSHCLFPHARCPFLTSPCPMAFPRHSADTSIDANTPPPS